MRGESGSEGGVRAIYDTCPSAPEHLRRRETDNERESDEREGERENGEDYKKREREGGRRKKGERQ